MRGSSWQLDASGCGSHPYTLPASFPTSFPPACLPACFLAPPCLPLFSSQSNQYEREERSRLCCAPPLPASLSKIAHIQEHHTTMPSRLPPSLLVPLYAPTRAAVWRCSRVGLAAMRCSERAGGPADPAQARQHPQSPPRPRAKLAAQRLQVSSLRKLSLRKRGEKQGHTKKGRAGREERPGRAPNILRMCHARTCWRIWFGYHRCGAAGNVPATSFLSRCRCLVSLNRKRHVWLPVNHARSPFLTRPHVTRPGPARPDLPDLI